MRSRVLFLLSVLLGTARVLAAQTIEERVSSLESQVAELWQLHDHAYAPGTMVPAELVGNEHLQCGATRAVTALC